MLDGLAVKLLITGSTSDGAGGGVEWALKTPVNSRVRISAKTRTRGTRNLVIVIIQTSILIVFQFGVFYLATSAFSLLINCGGACHLAMP
jgi:hypothetical protein